MGYISANKFVCEDNTLNVDALTGWLYGETTHFTSFGVVLSPTTSNGDGDGFDNVLIAPIVLSIFGAFVIVVVVIVVGALVTWWLTKRRRESISSMKGTLADESL